MAAGASGISSSGPSSSGQPAESSNSAPAQRVVGKSTAEQIRNAVDGGKPPVFGKEAIEARKKELAGEAPQNTPAPKAQSSRKETEQASDKQNAAQALKETGGSEDSILSSLREEFFPKKEDPETEENPEDLSDAELAQLGPRAQKRIQGLTKRLTDTLQENQRVKEEVSSMKQRVGGAFQKMQGQMQALHTQNAKMSAYIEAIMNGQVTPRNQVPQEEQDPVMALRDKMGLDKLFEQQLEERMAPVMQELNQFKQAQAKAQQRAEVEQVQKRLNFEVDRAASEVLLNGFSEEARSALGHRAGTLTLAYAYGRGMVNDPVRAATELRQLIGEFAVNLIEAKSKSSQAKRSASQQIEPSAEGGRSNPSARGNPVPTMADAKRAGAKNPLAAMMQRDGFVRSGG